MSNKALLASGLTSKCSFTLSKLRFLALRPASTDAAEREQRVFAHYAEPQGGKATIVVD
ncbi:MAG: hypothetical protein IIW87_04755 [Alistipes sp.]|nr:hypothetical protein [Alistipes sp.]